MYELRQVFTTKKTQSIKDAANMIFRSSKPVIFKPEAHL